MIPRSGRLYRDPTPRWQRTRNGALLLRRFGRQTLGVVVPNGDGTYSWLSRVHDQGDQRAQYATADEACAALLAILGLTDNLNVQRSRAGTLFLRRGHKDTIGVVAQRGDGTYRWFVPGTPDNGAAYQNEDDAYNALCDSLGLAA